MFEFLSNLSERHEKLKKRIHSFRIPLSPTGQKIMGFVYFCIPVISGYYIMDYAMSIGKKNNQIHFEKIRSNSPEHATSTKEQNKALQAILDKAKADKLALEKVK